MDDFQLILPRVPTRMEIVYQQNLIENVLVKCLPLERGLSMKQLKKVTGLTKRTINYHIYNSMFIENANPVLHGSWKTKIKVFNYTSISKKYLDRAKRAMAV